MENTGQPDARWLGKVHRSQSREGLVGRSGGELLSTAGTPQEGFNQGMQQREDSAYWEQNRRRKPSSGVPWPHHDCCPFPGGREPRPLLETTRTEPGPTPTEPASLSHYPHAPNSDSHNKTVNSRCTWAKIMQTACDIKNLRSIYFQYRGCRNVAALFKELFGVSGCLSELLFPVAEAGVGDRYMQLGS